MFGFTGHFLCADMCAGGAVTVNIAYNDCVVFLGVLVLVSAVVVVVVFFVIVFLSSSLLS